MWEYEHSVQTSADPMTVWQYWSDIAAWPSWNSGIAKITVDGPFQVGTVIAMTPPGEDEPVTLRLTDIVPGRLFADEMDGGGFVLRTVHRLDPAAGGRIRIKYRTEITGPAADQIGPDLGPAVTADFAEVLDALVTLAERQNASQSQSPS